MCVLNVWVLCFKKHSLPYFLVMADSWEYIFSPSDVDLYRDFSVWCYALTSTFAFKVLHHSALQNMWFSNICSSGAFAVPKNVAIGFHLFCIII